MGLDEKEKERIHFIDASILFIFWWNLDLNYGRQRKKQNL